MASARTAARSQAQPWTGTELAPVWKAGGLQGWCLAGSLKYEAVERNCEPGVGLEAGGAGAVGGERSPRWQRPRCREPWSVPS